ncbi:hypothetical protein SLEP1_g48490 [Rubroshorea leprosula]|uniref:Uncharacterized protein n=1 Tax=Rubroshorea leprosula TaxID=152421 RepID=A0AAV5LTR2_9ROSI|nr:hypothetical protein SLEP1_g48490 [Rubroshorea leprosula]
MHSFPKHFSWRTRPSRLMVLIISCLLLYALSAFIFTLTEFFNLSQRAYRCRTVDPRFVKVVWDQKSNSGNAKNGNDGENGLGNGNGLKRHKVMAFVGIQTGFGSIMTSLCLCEIFLFSAQRLVVQDLKSSWHATY